MTDLEPTQTNQNFSRPILTLGIILPLLIFTVLSLMLSLFENGLSWDNSFLLAIHNLNKPILNQIAINTTNFGELRGIIGLSVPIFIVLAYQKKWPLLAYLIITILSSAILNRIAKLVFHRVRPHLWELSSLPHGFSFPSGHAMGSMTLVIALLIITRKSKWFFIGAIVGSLYVLLIAWTRIYLGVHYLSDILGGWLLAIAWTIGLSLVFSLFTDDIQDTSITENTIELITDD